MSLRTVSLAPIRFNRSALPRLASASGFDRAAIMRKAVGIARTLRGSSLTWAGKMRIGLTTAWKAARQEREIAEQIGARPAAAGIVVFPRVAPRHPVRTFTSGSRAFSHSWSAP